MSRRTKIWVGFTAGFVVALLGVARALRPIRAESDTGRDTAAVAQPLPPK